MNTKLRIIEEPEELEQNKEDILKNDFKEKVTNDNKELIIQRCKEIIEDYDYAGFYNETVNVYFDTEECEVIGNLRINGLQQEFLNRIEDNIIIKVYSFKAGMFKEHVEECISYDTYSYQHLIDEDDDTYEIDDKIRQYIDSLSDEEYELYKESVFYSYLADLL